MTSAKEILEVPTRIEPARLEQVPVKISDLVAEIAAKSAVLGSKLNPVTAASLADLVRLMNSYYSNLIEGHNTHPRDAERALAGDFDGEKERRNLQLEAAAHIRLQKKVDHMAVAGNLPEPASPDFIKWLHAEFYKDAPEDMLLIKHGDIEFMMEPGEWRSRAIHDVEVGRHLPPSSERVDAFMLHFESRYRFEKMGPSEQIMAIAAAHHRFNYIHPFPDGNGRVSRLMSHAMALKAGIGAHALWSVSRGLARSLESRTDYKRMMDHADMPRQGDIDGRGNLSQKALVDFTVWFLSTNLDQLTFMSDLFDLENLEKRLKRFVEIHENLKPETFYLLQEALSRGQVIRGETSRITGLPERTARRVLNDIIATGLLSSDTPKAPVSLRFPADSVDILFPKLFPES